MSFDVCKSLESYDFQCSLYSRFSNLSLGVKISASWLANKECIYAVFLQQSAVFNIFAVQYEISYTMPSFCAKRQFSLQIRGFLILFCLHLSVWLVSISCFRCDVRYQQKTWTSKSSVSCCLTVQLANWSRAYFRHETYPYPTSSLASPPTPTDVIGP